MSKYTELKEAFANLEADADKFYNSKNAAAGTRLRKGLQILKTLAQEVRTEVTDTKNAGKGE